MPQEPDFDWAHSTQCWGAFCHLIKHRRGGGVRPLQLTLLWPLKNFKTTLKWHRCPCGGLEVLSDLVLLLVPWDKVSHLV